MKLSFSRGRRASIVLTFCVCLVTGCKEQWQNQFADAAQARASGLAAKGWLPPLPDDASDIVVYGDLDSGVAVGAYRSYAVALGVTCEEVNGMALPDYGKRWLERNGVQVGVEPKRGTLRVMQCSGTHFELATSESGGKVYFWSTR